MGFTAEDIVKGHWIKRNDHGVVRQLICHPDGSFTEWDPTNASLGQWKGEWTIYGGEGSLTVHFKALGYWMAVHYETDAQGLHSAHEMPPDQQGRGKSAIWVPFTVEHVE